MTRLRLAALLGVLAVCVALTPRPRTPPDEWAEVAPQEEEERPFALVARFGESGPRDPVERIDFSADGRRMISVGGGTVRAWDVPRGKFLWSSAVLVMDGLGGPARAAISADGRWALTCSRCDVLTIVRDAETGKVAGGDGKNDNRFLAGFDGPNRVWVRDLATGDFVSSALPVGAAGARVTPPGRFGFPLSSADGRVLVISAARVGLFLRDGRSDRGWVELESYRDQPMAACGRTPPACAVPIRFSPDGRFLLTWWRGFCLWDVGEPTPRMVRLTSVDYQDWWYPDATFSPDGRRLAAAVESDGKKHVRVWETASGTEAFRFDPPGGATGCGFTPDGTRLVVAHPDTTFSVWDYPALEARGVRFTGDVWDNLADREAKPALCAVGALANDPDGVAFLRKRLRTADAARVAKLVAELDDDDFGTREAAEKALADLGEAAEVALVEAGRSPSAEVRRRAGRLSAALAGPRSAARLRACRAVEALERAGTPAARELLAEWVKTRPGTALAAEAAITLVR